MRGVVGGVTSGGRGSSSSSIVGRESSVSQSLSASLGYALAL